MCVFFFKQKTAYEMRISDWSSDVCASDLVGIILILARHRPDEGIGFRARAHVDRPGRRNHRFLILHDDVARRLALAHEMHDAVGIDIVEFEIERSEEHTSELQSLMRISYAVFCLKTKNNANTCRTQQPIQLQ